MTTPDDLAAMDAAILEILRKSWGTDTNTVPMRPIVHEYYRQIYRAGMVAGNAAVEAQDKTIAELREQLRKATDYKLHNPLGGPAIALVSCAQRIVAGEEYYSALADFGLTTTEKNEADNAALRRESDRRLVMIRELWNLDPNDAAGDDLAMRVKRECGGQP